MTRVHLSLTRFCLSVPYALGIEKNSAKKSKKNPTYPNFFKPVTPNTELYFFGPK